MIPRVLRNAAAIPFMMENLHTHNLDIVRVDWLDGSFDIDKAIFNLQIEYPKGQFTFLRGHRANAFFAHKGSGKTEILLAYMANPLTPVVVELHSEVLEVH